MTVTLLEVVAAAQKHAAALPGELAGYLLLATADQVAAAPRCPAIDDVALDDDGAVRVIGGDAATDSQAERRLRELFAFTLGKSAPVTAALVRVTQRTQSGSVRGLIQELEAALIPLNRAASRRALSRLCRETMRAAARGELSDLAALAAAAEAREEPAAPARVADPVVAAPAACAEPALRVIVTAEAPCESPLSPATDVDEPSVPVAAPPRVAPCIPPPLGAEAAGAPDGSSLEVLLSAPSPAPPDSSAAPTPALHTSSAEAGPAEPPDESTRPEPVIARASQRPGPPSTPANPSLTPVLGSLSEPDCVSVEVARALPEVALTAGEATERMPDVETALESAAPPCAVEPETARPEAQAAESWPCEGFIAWESCAPPPVADGATAAPADAEALAVDAAWDEVALEVDRAFATMQRSALAPPEHEPVLAACVVLPLDSLTMTQPGGIVAERPLPPTPAKTPSAAPEPAWAPARFLPRKSDVDALLRGFCVADTRDERELCRELSEMAGVEASSSA